MTFFELEKYNITGIADPAKKLGINVEKPVSYNLVVIEELEASTGKFMIMKDGDTIKDLQEAIKKNVLDPIQQICLSNPRMELDFSSDLDMPF